MWFLPLLSLLLLTLSCRAQFDPNFVKSKGPRSGIVHLFEWKFVDIVNECEEFLGPNGYGGVQVSPVSENAIVEGRPWWERYQPVSYKIDTRSGDEEDFRKMVRRCNSAGVRIYVDVIANHMAAGDEEILGTAGSTAEPEKRSFPAVAYGTNDFNPSCTIEDYQDAHQVRNCELSGLPDLNQSGGCVKGKVVEFMNKLIDFGVAGFRMGACKYMWPHDLEVIYSELNTLNPDFGFSTGSKPFIYQEVIDMGNEPISKLEYNGMGVVTEFLFSKEIGEAFLGETTLHSLIGWGPDHDFLPSKSALVFVDNHDNQREHEVGADMILTHKNPRLYKMAVAFMLAHPYGHPRIMSSYESYGTDEGPPNEDGDITTPTFTAEGQCEKPWVCEHRWEVIRKMIKFRNSVGNAPIKVWGDNGRNQLEFCRAGAGYIAFNLDSYDFNDKRQTCLPPGVYCDVISGDLIDNACTGLEIEVGEDGKADILIPNEKEQSEGMVAIHIGAKVE